ncbi:FkbM family methyltransferase [Polynucleobacter sp. MWH-HuK1]|uniref:FkbM family methyltransferase n=1 Tax=Polynucleobacter sp. MWH-HuK1 TaxID=1743158 RepID=UPI001C0E4644|nr:FkbM family methyltransferase [Polynucleobacter sp. MWH-HuK1]MBU3564450.1 FkbM family methyltransferase [Polynucleobacter sp. MWH-HuK1]
MKKWFIDTATSVWQHIPARVIRECMWNAFLWYVRGRKVVTTVDQITFDLDLSELIDVCLYVNRFEKDVTSAINILCQRDWVVLDIGAHSLRFAWLVGNGGKVYAFEPTNYAFKKLQRNVALNKFTNLHLYQVALSNQSQPLQKISYRASWKTNGSQTQESSVVDFIRLDDWAAQQSLSKLDFIKIDVDGNEYAVFDGARELLRKFKPILIAEVGAYHFADSSTNPWQIIADLEYRFWDVHTGKEYGSLAAMREVLKGEDTINVIASTKELSVVWR